MVCIWSHDLTSLNANDISIAISNVTITALNNKAIEFILPNPIASFPLALDKPVFKSKTFYGTGEFRIVDIDSVDGIVKKISLVPKDKNLPRVDIKFYQSEEQAASALKIGEIKYVSVSNAKIFEGWQNVEVEKTPDNSEIVTIFFNTEDPNFASKDLRQALSFAINRSELDGGLATGPISPSSWAYSQNTKRYEYNTAKAKELIARIEAQNLKVELSVTPDLLNVAESIQKDWQAVGVETTIKEENGIPQSFQALLAVNKLNPDPDQYALWHSSQKETNITRFKDVKIDKLLEDARISQDENKRKELYADFQRFLVEDAPATFLYHPNKYTVIYKNAKNLIEKLPKT
jgi:peptide/nickel transport system substrate-binding protein